MYTLRIRIHTEVNDRIGNEVASHNLGKVAVTKEYHFDIGGSPTADESFKLLQTFAMKP